MDRAQAAAAVEAYQKEEVSLAGLGARYGVSGRTIGRELQRAGITPRPQGRRLGVSPAPDTARLLQLHGTGLTPADIAAELGCERDRVCTELTRHGRTPHRGRRLPAAPELILAYAQAGTLRKLARQLKRSEPRIAAALTDAGCPPGRLRSLPPDRRIEEARQIIARQTAHDRPGRPGPADRHAPTPPAPRAAQPDRAAANAA